ncbi:MAG: hypothetical protein ACLPH3_23765 [Terracidiphilus sp.]
MSAVEVVTKIDAARRQLATAIDLWFNDKDAVSIHTLAYAAYDVIHGLSKRRGRKQSLIMDYEGIKDEYKQVFRKAARKAGNYFKHADYDPDENLDFNPASNELFIFFAILGVELMGITINPIERAFVVWRCLQYPHLMTEHGRKMFSDSFPGNEIKYIRTIPKHEFFHEFLQAYRR